jgi:hypothetical protein
MRSLDAPIVTVSLSIATLEPNCEPASPMSFYWSIQLPPFLTKMYAEPCVSVESGPSKRAPTITVLPDTATLFPKYLLVFPSVTVNFACCV